MLVWVVVCIFCVKILREVKMFFFNFNWIDFKYWGEGLWIGNCVKGVVI